MVRRAASGKLGEFAAAIFAKSQGVYGTYCTLYCIQCIGLCIIIFIFQTLTSILDMNIIKNEIVPLFRTLAKDYQDSVRLLTVGACVEIAKILTKEDIENDVSYFL